MTPSEIAKLERYIGYEFVDQNLLVQAVTHRSFSAHNNERLEFLGDGVLNFIVAETLYKQFPDAAEGQLSRLRAMLVKQKTLAEIARELNLSDFLVMGTGELKSGGYNRDSILSDTVEAILGAAYLESGFATAVKLVLGWYKDRFALLSLEQAEKDAKSQLQEWLQAQKHPLPDYQVVTIEGEAHEQQFTIKLDLPVLESSIEASGPSRRAAEQNAAAEALAQIAVGINNE